MPLCFSRDQQDFARSVRAVLERVDRPYTSDDQLVEHDAWQSVTTELSLLSIAVPEEMGGLGGDWGDVAAAMSELGRCPVIGGMPAAQAGIAALTAARSVAVTQLLGEIIAAQQAVVPTWLYTDRVWVSETPGRAMLSRSVLPSRRFDGRTDSDVIIGHPVAGHVRLLIPVETAAGLEIWLSDALSADELQVATVPSLDTTTQLGIAPEVELKAEAVIGGDEAGDTVTRSRAVALALATMEALGSCDHLLRTAVDYLKVREQFGQVLAGMQALKFTAADLFREIEPARSLAFAAVDSLQGADLTAMEETATAAKIVADRLHARVALEVIQLHGGIGFTWELGLHRHYKRAVANRVLGGDDRRRRAQLATEIQNRSTTLKHQWSAADDAAAAIRSEVREWITQNRSHAPAALTAHEPMSYRHSAQDRDWIDRVRDGGWLCLSWPKEYGGRALDELECIAVNEEFAAAGIPRPTMGMGETLLAPALLSHGSADQKARLLPRILSGEDVYCQGFSEPEHGSDLASLETRGVQEGAGLVVNGTKVWQSGAHRANKIFLLCRTDVDAAPHRGITYCIADMDANGVQVTPLRMMPGDYGFNEVRFENTVVPLDDVVGELNGGWHVAMTTLGAERAGEITSQHLGYLREFDMLVERLDELGRLEEGSPDLVELWLEIAKMKYNGRRVVDQIRSGEPADDLLSVDKLNWSEYHVRFGLDAARLLGVDGIVRPTGDGYQLTTLQRVMLESPGRRIARGTNQIQRRIIAERRMGMPR
ncbi:acyl-CoA dehydrogenase [Cumulibacter manganitolerans]|uniref:acyl-CoA dehydrogenase n=1 Tax=Cumulibacter manganitolerans TaxID=1884992 RepID=UPI0012968E1B|nr:acyl-CoA dehydrogenase [Cumulibacter manganitolerans]